MTVSSVSLPVSPDSSCRLAIRAVRSIRAQVEDWHDESRALTDWEDQMLVDDPGPDRLAEHSLLLDELERVGRWLASATQSPDFPDRQTAEIVALTLRDLADRRAMWHGQTLNEQQRTEVLKACFDES